MGETKEFEINDTYRALEKLIGDLRAWESTSADPRVKALVITKLEEAQLWSLRLIKP